MSAVVQNLFIAMNSVFAMSIPVGDSSSVSLGDVTAIGLAFSVFFFVLSLWSGRFDAGVFGGSSANDSPVSDLDYDQWLDGELYRMAHGELDNGKVATRRVRY